MNDTKPKHTHAQDLPDPARWPATRRALVLTKQEQLDAELAGSNRDWAEWRDAQTVTAALKGDPAALDEVARALLDEADAERTVPGLGDLLGADQ